MDFASLIAGKLKSRTLIQVINLEIIFEGAISILDNNNPIVVYEKLSSFITVKDRRPLSRMRPTQHAETK